MKKPRTAPDLATNHLSDPFFEYLPEEDQPALFNAGWCFQAAQGMEALVKLLRNDRASWLPQEVDYGSPPLTPEHGNGLFSALAALSTALRQEFERWHGDQTHARDEALQDNPGLNWLLWDFRLMMLRGYLNYWPPGDDREKLVRLFTPWLEEVGKLEARQPGTPRQWRGLGKELVQLLQTLDDWALPAKQAHDFIRIVRLVRAQLTLMHRLATRPG